MKIKNKKLKGIKQLRKGSSDMQVSGAEAVYSSEPGIYTYGSTPTVAGSYGGDSGEPTTQTQQSQKDTGFTGAVDSTTLALNLIGKTIFDVSGLGLAAKVVKPVAEKIQQVLTPQITKDTTKARLSGSQIFDYAKTPQTIPTPDTGGGDNNELILKKPILQTPAPMLAKETFSAKKFFPFRAYNSGGVSSGPPPKRGPNPQVPPVKLRNGGVKTKSKKSDNMRGAGKAIRGTNFTGVF